MSWLSDLFGTGAQVALANYGVNEAREAGREAQQSLTSLGNQLRSDLQFRPYTVTSGTGGVNATAQGTTTTLSPEMQALQQQLLGGATNLFGQAMMPVENRAGAITAALEAAASPTREREMLGLENRLRAQGRLGVRTDMFGGTPEQLALSKAIEEQRLNNALMGRQQAIGEQMQAYNVGAGMLGQSFLPQQMLLQDLASAVPFAELSTRGQQQGAVLGAQLAGQGVEARMQAEQQGNALRQIYLQQMLQGLMQPQYSTDASGNVTQGGSLLSGIFSGIGDLFK